MSRWLHVGWAGSAVLVLIGVACSAGTNPDGDASSVSNSTSGPGASGGESSRGGAGGSGSTVGGFGGDLTVGIGGSNAGGSGGAMGCAQFTAEAQAKPAAMLITLDQSTSMTGTKWNAARFAVTTSMDKDVFDSMSLGLTLFPHSLVGAPPCICDAIAPFPCPQVSCGTFGGPQISLELAGANKSTAGNGVRYDIATYMNSSGPLGNSDDGSPIYEALDEGYAALEGLVGVDERIMLLVTDGGFSCTSLSNPQRIGYDDGLCPDWEYPDSVNALISGKFNGPTAPIRTFIVGVPGSDTNGENVGTGCPFSPCYATPPYSMKLALSTYAVSGSPDTVDPACESGLTFSQGGTDPTTPCHIDMTTGQFDANALADVIANIRGDALGCVYPLPEPPPGETIDPTKVNVEVTLDGNATVTIPQRATPTDDCAVNACWDYNLGGEIEILGAGCDDISSANEAKVDIVVGCETIIN